MRTAFEMIRPGVRGCDAVGAIYQAQISGTKQFGGDYPAFIPIISAGEYSSAPHLTWTEKPFENEQPVILELCGGRFRYHCPMCRTMYLGDKPSQGLKETADIVAEGIAAALSAIKPGAVCEEIEAAWRKTVAKYGIEKEARMGYAMGLNYPPDWGEHTASFRPGDRTVLEPNMTFHMTPCLWSDNWGLRMQRIFTGNGKRL
jgi:Xaa-Pro dipeptidase